MPNDPLRADLCSFLTAHEVFGGPIPGGSDAYVDEWARAATMVGVAQPPRSAAALRTQIDGYAGQLRRTPATDRTLAFLRRPPLPVPARAGYAVLFAGAVSTLRPEHRALLGLRSASPRASRLATRAMLNGLRAVLSDGPPAARAARRRLERIGQPMR